MDFERKKIEIELRLFVARNFVKPSECRDIQQVRYYIRELVSRMETMRGKGFIPPYAYTLLAQYNSAQNKLLAIEFNTSYC